MIKKNRDKFKNKIIKNVERKSNSKFKNMILKNAASRQQNIKKYSVYYNSEEIDVNCIKIKTVDEYKSMIEYSILNSENEWYLITGINKISKSKIIEDKEYIFTNAKNVIEFMNPNFDENFPNNFTNIFITPRGTVSFFGIKVGQRLWIK